MIDVGRQLSRTTQLVQTVANDVQTNPATGHIRHIVSSTEAMTEEQIEHLLRIKPRGCLLSDNPSAHGRRAHAIDVDAPTVVFNCNLHIGPERLRT